MGGREKKAAAETPEWMVTFGDMMSLLLCFFIMLFALSTITPIKWEAFVETQNMKMGYSGTSNTPSQSNKPSAALGSVSERARRSAALAGGQPTPGQAGESVNRQTIRDDGTTVKGGLIRFDLGKDYLTDQAKRDLKVLLPILEKSTNKIRITGHVSPAEEEEGIFSRGIYLAQNRAVNVMEHLISLGLQKEFFEVSISTSIPNRAILPRGTNPRLAGASAAVYLIDGKLRSTPQEPTPQEP